MAIITRYVNTDNTVSGDGTTNETDGSPDSAYTSLSASLAAEKTDLVSAQNSLVILCEGSNLDTTGTGVTTGTWVTTNDYNVTIKPNVGQEHNGVWDDSKYRIERLHFDSGSIGSFVIDGLQIKGSSNLQTIRLVGATFSGSVGIQVVKNCLISYGRSSVGSMANHCVYITRNGPQIFLYNNIIYVSASSQHTPNAISRAVYSDGSNNLKFYNNTVVGDFSYGFDVGGPNYLKNNIFSGIVSSSYFGTPTTDEYNATSDGDATGTGARTNQTFSFINPSINDYRLSSKDKGAARFGVDVSNDTLLTDYTQSLTTDIVGTTRTTPWEIGAYQLPYDETEGRVIPKPSDPPKTFPTYIAAVSGTWGNTTENDLTIDVGSGVNRKAVVFLVNQDNQARTEPFPYTCSYEPTGENIRLDRVLDGGDLSQFDSYYYTSLFYYDIPDNDSGTKTFRFNTPYTLRGGGQIVIYKDSLSGAPYTSSVETAVTQSAGGPHPFSYVSASLTLDGPSTVVSFALFEQDVSGATLSPLGIETVRGNFNYGVTLGGDVIAGDFKSNKPTITTEYTSSQSGSLVTCTALALQSPGYAPDFKIQRGVVNTTAVSSSVLLAGVDYEPINSSSAFVRITSNRSIGSGQYADFAGGDEQFKISDITNIETSLQFEKVGTTTDGDTIDWEIIEYTGRSGGDNEFIVRHVEELTFSDGSVTQQSSSVVPNIQNDNDVVVFLGGANRLSDAGANRNEPVTLAVTSWDSSSQRAFVDKYQEAQTAGRGSELQIMVVEFTGKNWKVQRIPEHTFSSRDEESISIPVNISSTSSAFIHSQYRFDQINGIGGEGNKNLTAKVYLKDVNTIEAKVTGSAAGTQGSGSVAVWLIENTQKHGQKMNVTHYSGFRDRELSTNPDIFSSSLQSTVNIDTTSIMGESAARDISNLALNDYNNLQFSIGISSSGQEVVITRGTDINGIDYTFSTVEWPTEYRNKGISIQSDTQWFFDDFSWANGTKQSIHNNPNWQQLSAETMSVDTNEKVQATFPGDPAGNLTYRLARIDPTQVQFSDDHYAEVIVDEDDGIGFDFRGPAVRMISGSGGDSGSGYILRVDLAYGGTGRSILRMDSGSSVGLGSVGIIPKEGDRVGIQAVGSNISSFLNGQLIETVVDSTYTTGQPGMFYKLEHTGQDSIDNFFAKDVVSGQTGKPFKIS